MRTSCTWLRDYIDIDWDARQLTEKLTMAGLEVEGIEEVISELSVMPRMLSIGPNNLLDYLTPEQYSQLNNSYNGDMYDA